MSRHLLAVLRVCARKQHSNPLGHKLIIQCRQIGPKFYYYPTAKLHFIISDLGLICFTNLGGNLEVKHLFEEASPIRVCLVFIRFLGVHHSQFTYINKLPYLNLNWLVEKRR